MNRAELLDLLRGGEDSTVASKRDDMRNHDLAKELVAFLNLEGGVVLLGVEDDGIGRETLLRNLGLMTESAGVRVVTVDGLLLFGQAPVRYLPQSGVRAVCYPGAEPDYAARADEDLRGPLAPLGAADGSLVENGLVDRAWDFVRRNTAPTARLEGARRIDGWEYPGSVVREALVNALVHRDYSIAGTDVMLAIYADRLEIQSPGRLPNTVTVEGMRAGVCYTRNQMLINVMRDYVDVDARGMGVRNKLFPRMRAQRHRTRPDGGGAPLHRPPVEGR